MRRIIRRLLGIKLMPSAREHNAIVAACEAAAPWTHQDLADQYVSVLYFLVVRGVRVDDAALAGLTTLGMGRCEGVEIGTQLAGMGDLGEDLIGIISAITSQED